MRLKKKKNPKIAGFILIFLSTGQFLGFYFYLFRPPDSKILKIFL